jgi:hypothetical protein
MGQKIKNKKKKKKKRVSNDIPAAEADSHQQYSNSTSPDKTPKRGDRTPDYIQYSTGLCELTGPCAIPGRSGL